MASKGKFDFDVDGLDGTEEAEEAPAPESLADNLVDSLYEEPEADPRSNDEEESELDSQMLAVEERLQQAQYYRLMLNESFFKEETPLSRKVDREVRAFVRARLSVLMGVQAEPTKQAPQRPPDFTDSEIRNLKQLAATLQERATRAGAAVPAPAPVPVPPAMKKIESKPQEPVAAPAPVKRQPVVVAPRAKPSGPPPRPSGAVKLPGAGKVPIDYSRVPEKYRNDPTLQYKNGRLYVQAKNADEQPLWESDTKAKTLVPLLKDITLPAAPGPSDIQPLPMPSMGTGTSGLTSPFSQAMAIQEDSMVGFAEKRANQLQIGGLLTATVVSNLTGES
jgi:hypothetical protein